MELIKNKWEKKDIKEFQEYLETFKNPSREQWSRNLLRTKLPVLCMKTVDMKDIIKKISKGNYLSFLDLWIWEYYENTALNGSLISLIDDFDTYKKYLDIYSSKADNWATCDLLTFNIKNHEEDFLMLSKRYTKSDKLFVRRIGLYVLFNLIDNDSYIDEIYKIINEFNNEAEYYVNMMIGWLLSELFIKRREMTLDFLEKNNLNKIAINKCIQKCRESRRVSLEDKEMLLKYKIK